MKTNINLAKLYPVAKPLLMAMDAESAHELTIKALKTLNPKPLSVADDSSLRVTLWNRNFPNPVGLAAGFDKGAEVIAPMLSFGFGFIEAGTVTPKRQEGNERPRVFRDLETEAVINRMGFPSAGGKPFKRNLEKFLSSRPRPAGLVGINIGMNKSQTEPQKDYCKLVGALGPLADYIAVNISSPNTPGLRNLQEPEAFLDLIGHIMEERTKACGKEMPPPILVKLSPDLEDEEQHTLAEAVMKSGIDGIILTNTTLNRPEYLERSFRFLRGGLSGKPIAQRSTLIIRNFYRLTNGKIPIIGAGGVSSAQEAYTKIRAGASLVQLYSALIFNGPGIVEKIKSDLVALLKADGHASVQDAVGTRARE